MHRAGTGRRRPHTLLTHAPLPTRTPCSPSLLTPEASGAQQAGTADAYSLQRWIRLGQAVPEAARASFRPYHDSRTGGRRKRAHIAHICRTFNPKVAGRSLPGPSRKTKERPKALFGSPSRFRFRPPSSLTLGLRLLPSRPASPYSRSVLGAGGNLGDRATHRKSPEREKSRKLGGPIRSGLAKHGSSASRAWQRVASASAATSLGGSTIAE